MLHVWIYVYNAYGSTKVHFNLVMCTSSAHQSSCGLPNRQTFVHHTIVYFAYIEPYSRVGELAMGITILYKMASCIDSTVTLKTRARAYLIGREFKVSFVSYFNRTL